MSRGLKNSELNAAAVSFDRCHYNSAAVITRRSSSWADMVDVVDVVDVVDAVHAGGYHRLGIDHDLRDPVASLIDWPDESFAAPLE